MKFAGKAESLKTAFISGFFIYLNKIYPEHMNFKTCHMAYRDGIGWRLSTELGLGVEKQWVKFHRKNAEYEKIEPTKHRKKTTEEIKFNTSIKHKVWDILK